MKKPKPAAGPVRKRTPAKPAADIGSTISADQIEFERGRLEFERRLERELELARPKIEVIAYSPWVNAILAVEELEDPAPLLALLGAHGVPAWVMPNLKDLFDRKLGPRQHDKGPKIPLYKDQSSKIYMLAGLVHAMITAGLTKKAAFDRLYIGNPDLAKPVPRETLESYYSGKDRAGRRFREQEGLGRRSKEKRRPK